MDVTEGFQPGDILIASDSHPVGIIEHVLHPTSGILLVIERAWAQRQYVVASATMVYSSEQPFGTTSWHTLSVPLATVISRGVYRRVMGRLVPDPHRGDIPRPHSPANDTAAASAILPLLASQPLTAAQPVTCTVRHGVACLGGRISTDAGSLEASHLARSVTDVWHVLVNVVSDEALVSHLRRAIRTDTESVPHVLTVSVRDGQGLIEVNSGTPSDAISRLANWTSDIEGLDSIEVRVASIDPEVIASTNYYQRNSG